MIGTAITIAHPIPLHHSPLQVGNSPVLATLCRCPRAKQVSRDIHLQPSFQIIHLGRRQLGPIAADTLVHQHERMLGDGFYAEVTLTYDAAIAEEKHGRPFAIESLRAILLSKADVVATLAKGRSQFTTNEWKDFLIRSISASTVCKGKRELRVQRSAASQ